MNDNTPDVEYRLREISAAYERRIETLERLQAQRSAAAWLGPLFGVAALVVAIVVSVRTSDVVRSGSQAVSVEAGAFRLTDSQGVERAALGLGEDGGASLTVSDGTGRPRLRLSVLADGSPGVSLLDPQGDSRAILGLLDDGTTTLVFADHGSVARGVFAVTPDGSSRIIFSDANGVTRTAVGVDGSGQPEINTIDVGSDGSSGNGGQ